MIIETEALTKLYGKKTGCKNISITVREGQIYAFLGPNGAGKSTFIKMLTGLIFPTSGRAEVLGKPLGDVEVREKLGYLPENFKYQDWMSGQDLLSFHASLYKLDRRISESRIEEVLELVKLKGNEKYKIGSYSKGMQQRIGIASSLLCDPQLIILDEPTSALDPIGRKEVRDIMVELKKRGKTIFLNSHLLSDVEMLCDSVAIINKGSIIKEGPLDTILYEKVTLEIHADNITGPILQKLGEIDKDMEYERDRICLQISGNEETASIAELIINNGGRLYGLIPHRETLENAFIRLIEGENYD
ncbi:MAG: ABC transporter ATP-binding protein [Bacillota bacterium]|nr:ABC transporter ATP-binding protein [Bacillota bacterium]